MSLFLGNSKELRLFSLVEALRVTGPVRPILIFSSLIRSRFEGVSAFTHAIATTRRSQPKTWPQDELFAAAAMVGAEGVMLSERRPFDLAVLTQLRRALHEFRPDVIETHDCKSHFLLRVVRAYDQSLRQVTWVAFHHGYTRTSLRIMAYQQLDRLTLPSADRVVTLCQPFAKMLEARRVNRGRIDVIANTIDPPPPPPLSSVAEARARLGIADDEQVILSVGRLSKEKGHADLLAALGHIVEKGFSKIRLVIAGDGPERTILERLAAPLAPHVIFAGQIADPWPLYHLAQIFVLPSHSEGSPLVVLESMAAQLPIVSTVVGGVPEILTHRRSALLVPPRSPSQLAAAIIELLRNEPLRLQLAAAASAAFEQRTPSEYAKRLLSIYEAAMTNRRS